VTEEYSLIPDPNDRSEALFEAVRMFEHSVLKSITALNLAGSHSLLAEGYPPFHYVKWESFFLVCGFFSADRYTAIDETLFVKTWYVDILPGLAETPWEVIQQSGIGSVDLVEWDVPSQVLEVVGTLSEGLQSIEPVDEYINAALGVAFAAVAFDGDEPDENEMYAIQIFCEKLKVFRESVVRRIEGVFVPPRIDADSFEASAASFSAYLSKTSSESQEDGGNELRRVSASDLLSPGVQEAPARDSLDLTSDSAEQEPSVRTLGMKEASSRCA
jgi:hypothetical protein